jgi:NTE family protein
VVALRQHPRQASEATLSDQRIEKYASPLFLFGKVLNALLLDHLDTDLARLRLMNEIIEDGEKAFGPDFQDQLNEMSGRNIDRRLRKIHNVVIRPSADLGILAGHILGNMSETRARSPLIRLAARNLSDEGRSPEADLLSYLLFDGEFLAPLAELGYADARTHEEDLCEFFADAPARL